MVVVADALMSLGVVVLMFLVVVALVSQSRSGRSDCVRARHGDTPRSPPPLPPHPSSRPLKAGHPAVAHSHRRRRSIHATSPVLETANSSSPSHGRQPSAHPIHRLNKRIKQPRRGAVPQVRNSWVSLSR